MTVAGMVSRFKVVDERRPDGEWLASFDVSPDGRRRLIEFFMDDLSECDTARVMIECRALRIPHCADCTDEVLEGLLAHWRNHLLSGVTPKTPAMLRRHRADEMAAHLKHMDAL